MATFQKAGPSFGRDREDVSLGTILGQLRGLKSTIRYLWDHCADVLAIFILL